MTVAFDAQTTSIRTATTDPYTFSHTGRATGSGGIQGVAVLVLCGTAVTDEVNTITYGGVTLTEIQQNTDTTTEPGNAQLWFVGKGLSGLGGTQTVSVDFTSATATDHQITVVTFTGSTDLEVIAHGGITNNVANPSVTLSYQGRTAITVGGVYSGLAAPTDLTINGNMTAMGSNDMGLFVTRSDRQTTPGTSNFTFSYTAATDDLALVAAAISEVETTWDERFEGGSDGTNITLLNSTLAGVGSGGTIAFENTPFVPNGSTYCRITTSAGTRIPNVDVVRAEGSLTVYRLYFRTSNPAAVGDFWRLHDTVGGAPRVRLDLDGTGHVNMRDANTTRYTSSKALAADEWVRLEVFVDETNNQIRGHMWWGQDLHSTSTAATEYESFGTRTWTQADFNQIRFGIIVTATATADFDGIAWRNASSTTDYIGPPASYNAVPDTSAYDVVGIPMN